jgi:hypothetical protein
LAVDAADLAAADRVLTADPLLTFFGSAEAHSAFGPAEAVCDSGEPGGSATAGADCPARAAASRAEPPVPGSVACGPPLSVISDI